MSWEKVGRDIESGPLGMFKWVFIFIIVVALFVGGMAAIMRPASMAVDRIVMKNSFQYVEGMEQRAAILEANIAEINVQMQRFPEKADELRGQKMMLSAQLKAITINQ